MTKSTASFIVDKRDSSQAYLPASLQTLTGNSETVEVDGVVVRVDAGGSARTGTILQVGREAGQICYVLNEGGEVIDLAAAATSNVSGASGSVGWQNGQAYTYIWDATNSLWAPAGAALS